MTNIAMENNQRVDAKSGRLTVFASSWEDVCEVFLGVLVFFSGFN